MDLDELYTELKKNELQRTLRLDMATHIKDVQKFVESHYMTLKTHKGNKNYLPYYNRLLKTLKFLQNE